MDGAESQAHPTFDFVELQIQFAYNLRIRSGLYTDAQIRKMQEKHVVCYFLRAQSDKG